MTTRGSSEVLKDAGDHMVDMEDMFGNPKKEWRNPLVLCGAVATAGVLVAGLASFRQGNFRTSQMLMRTRVVFQAGTVALMAGTVYFQGVQAKLRTLWWHYVLCSMILCFLCVKFSDA